MSLLNDSIAQIGQDTLRVVVEKCVINPGSAPCAPCNQASTNDIWIVGIICGTIFLVALLAFIAVLCSKCSSREQEASTEANTAKKDVPAKTDPIKDQIDYLSKIKSLCTKKDGTFDEAIFEKLVENLKKIEK